MALLLVQHGKSLSKEVDPEQGLSEEGRVETGKMASSARKHGVWITRIEQSGKTRAAQTAEIFASALQPADGVLKVDGLGPLDDAAAFAKGIDPSVDLMLVGHLPFMERLASFLVAGDCDKPIIRFQNSGIVCLEKEDDVDRWTIRWTLFPRIG